MNPWHDVSTGLDTPEWINGIIENPKEDTRANYVLDKKTGLLNLESVVYSSNSYPANYGFIPKTYASNKEPLDILILSSISIVPLCIVRAKVIGAICIEEGDENRDDKIVAVAANDPSVNYVDELEQLPAYHYDNLNEYINQYSKARKQNIYADKLQSKSVALKIIRKAMEAYKERFV